MEIIGNNSARFPEKNFRENVKIFQVSWVFIVLVFIGNILIMNKSQRIYFSTGDTGNENQDKFITVKLEQDIDTLEFMSLKLGTTDVYQNFNADYGVLIGRVLANGGIGIPNAKISIFIPVDDVDAADPEIYSVYPYMTPRDENNDGKRYNLLPRVPEKDPVTKQLHPKQAFGSFPLKEEVVANPPFLEVYKKYYKYTALTNKAGDYMIFGVPVGTQTVHMSCDITDIGEFSMNPASMIINLGYSENQFINQGTRIKPSEDLGDLPHIETQEITVDIKPFWGDAENFEIGIVRQDFRIRATLTNTFTIFGSAFTDSDQTMRATDGNSSNTKEIRDFFYANPKNAHCTSMATKRIGRIKETIYYYPPNISDADISSADPVDDMLVLDPSEYSAYYRNGDFAFIINCNRDRIVTNEFGDKVPVNYDEINGVFTTFRGFVTLEYTVDELPMVNSSGIEIKSSGVVEDKNRTFPMRIKLKFPQHAGKANSFSYRDDEYSDTWRAQYMFFEAQKFYSFSRFHACVANDEGTDNQQWDLKETITDGVYRRGGFFKGDEINYSTTNNIYNIGTIIPEDHDGFPNSQYGFPANYTGSPDRFGANWINFSVYFPQMGYALNTVPNVDGVRTADYLATQWKDASTSRNDFYIFDNSQNIAAGRRNTKWFGRSDLHWTDIIEIPLSDILYFATLDKGFKLTGGFDGLYRNGNYDPPTTDWKGNWSAACPYSGGGANGTPGGTDSYFYFYKGFDSSDCIEFLFELGLVNE